MEFSNAGICCGCTNFYLLNQVGFCGNCWKDLTPEERNSLGYPDPNFNLLASPREIIRDIIYKPNPSAIKIIIICVFINCIINAIISGSILYFLLNWY